MKNQDGIGGENMKRPEFWR